MSIKKNQLYKNSLIVAIASFLVLIAIEAKSQENRQIIVEPEQLTIAGKGDQKITRTITLTSDEAINPEKIEISFRDLYRTDNLKIFPKIAQSEVREAKENNNLEYQIPLVFDLGQANSKGEFSGKIVLHYYTNENNVEVINLPITTKIKSDWQFPLLSILLGSAVGMGLSWYRSKGRPRDEILVRLGRLQTWIGKDPKFDSSRGFKTQVEFQLSNVRSAVQEERWEDAESSLTTAKTIWQKWHRGKTLWLPQLEYANQLETSIADINPPEPFKGQILYKIAAQVEQAPDLDSVEQFRNNLAEVASNINVYHQIQNQIKQIKNLAAELAQISPELAKEWQPRFIQWQEQFVNLTPDGDLGSFLAELTQGVSELDEAIPRGRGNSTAKDLSLSDEPIIQEAPIGIDRDLATNLLKANFNLKIFAWVSYAIALMLLVGAGFNEMYLKQDTFGERPFGDYFALIAWGFGAEASRDAIGKTLEGWGLSGLDKN